jgi:hypothetical protein
MIDALFWYTGLAAWVLIALGCLSLLAAEVHDRVGSEPRVPIGVGTPRRLTIMPERASSGPMRATPSAGRLRPLRLSAHCFENSTNKPKRTRLSCQIANNLSQTLHLIASPGIGLRVAFSSFSTQHPGQ